jgi:hypothetical protein
MNKQTPMCWIFGELGNFSSRPNKYTVAVFAISAADARSTANALYGSCKLIKVQYPYEAEYNVTWSVVSEAKKAANREQLKRLLARQ